MTAKNLSGVLIDMASQAARVAKQEFRDVENEARGDLEAAGVGALVQDVERATSNVETAIDAYLKELDAVDTTVQEAPEDKRASSHSAPKQKDWASRASEVSDAVQKANQYAEELTVDALEAEVDGAEQLEEAWSDFEAAATGLQGALTKIGNVRAAPGKRVTRKSTAEWAAALVDGLQTTARELRDSLESDVPRIDPELPVEVDAFQEVAEKTARQLTDFDGACLAFLEQIDPELDRS